jgi:L,D-transpeptidase ErfK/SrfK
MLMLLSGGCATVKEPAPPAIVETARIPVVRGPEKPGPPLTLLGSGPPPVISEFVPGRSTVIGSATRYKIREGESLIEIARMFNIGFNSITAANPGVDPFIPEADLPITIPTEWVLPDVAVRHGIVINVSEMRLYFFRKEHVSTFPIGIGDDGKETPLGAFTIVEKKARPDWRVPRSIRLEDPRLPDVVPPGPRNPLGSHALRLSSQSILLHGTNRPWGIGRKVSHGCIQLYPENIPWLFRNVRKGTTVSIVRQPVKVGTKGKQVFLEVHRDGNINYENEALKILRRKKLLQRVNRARVKLVAQEKKGIPIRISD